jgi:hypothetical protein
MANAIYTGRLTDPMFEGVPVMVRGCSFIVPELNIRNRRQVDGEVAPWANRADKASLQPATPEYREFHDLIQKVALMALQQNYPEMTSEIMLDNFNDSQLFRVFRLSLGRPEKEDVPAGDGQARPTPSPNGTISPVS